MILRSDKPQAEPFIERVTAEVLPAIRLTGSYQIAGESSGRTVEVKHTHLRGTTPPGSLDIRYTLDLSKIILHPTKRNVAMLQRLTGIELSDVLAENPIGDSQNSILLDFINSSCVRAIDKRVPLAKVYARYLAWCNGTGCQGFEVASRRSFGQHLREAGCIVRLVGGTVYVYDISLIEEVAA